MHYRQNISEGGWTPNSPPKYADDYTLYTIYDE